MVESYGVAAFRSRQQVLRFEQQLRQEGIGNIRDPKFGLLGKNEKSQTWG